MTTYSATASDHFQNPRNVGALPNATAIGHATDDENQVWIYLRVVGHRIQAARFRALACNSCIACASVMTELIAGLGVGEARTIRVERLLEALDGLPSDKLHCAALTCQALASALDAAAQE